MSGVKFFLMPDQMREPYIQQQFRVFSGDFSPL